MRLLDQGVQLLLRPVEEPSILLVTGVRLAERGCSRRERSILKEFDADEAEPWPSEGSGELDRLARAQNLLLRHRDPQRKTLFGLEALVGRDVRRLDAGLPDARDAEAEIRRRGLEDGPFEVGRLGLTDNAAD